jgi:hypothetical protein
MTDEFHTASNYDGPREDSIPPASIMIRSTMQGDRIACDATAGNGERRKPLPKLRGVGRQTAK